MHMFRTPEVLTRLDLTAAVRKRHEAERAFLEAEVQAQLIEEQRREEREQEKYQKTRKREQLQQHGTQMTTVKNELDNIRYFQKTYAGVSDERNVILDNAEAAIADRECKRTKAIQDSMKYNLKLLESKKKTRQQKWEEERAFMDMYTNHLDQHAEAQKESAQLIENRRVVRQQVSDLLAHHLRLRSPKPSVLQQLDLDGPGRATAVREVERLIHERRQSENARKLRVQRHSESLQKVLALQVQEKQLLAKIDREQARRSRSQLEAEAAQMQFEEGKVKQAKRLARQHLDQELQEQMHSAWKRNRDPEISIKIGSGPGTKAVEPTQTPLRVSAA